MEIPVDAYGIGILYNTFRYQLIHGHARIKFPFLFLFVKYHQSKFSGSWLFLNRANLLLTTELMKS